MVTLMKPTITVPLLSISLLLTASTGTWAQQPTTAAVAEPAATAPAATTTPTEPAAPAPVAPAPAEAVAPAEAPEPEAKAAAASDDAAAKPAVVTPAPTSLTADEIARHHPSEWEALIDQRERDLQRQRQNSYMTWPSPYGGQMDGMTRRMEDQMASRMQQLQRRMDFQRNRYQSPWDRASSDRWDYQRSQSRLQSLRTQEYLDRMIERGMGPNRGYQGYRGPRGW